MPLADRRRALEGLAGQLGLPLAPTNLRRIAPGEPFVVTPQTLDRATARAWLDDRDATGRDGLIARHADGRRWLRVRRVRTAACVATGYRHAGSGVGSIRLGMYDGGRLIDVGRTVAFSRAPVRRAAATALARVSPGGAVSLVGADWVEVLPALACEVRYERLRGNRFRHAVTFVRWLPDRDPSTCTIDQLRTSPSPTSHVRVTLGAARTTHFPSERSPVPIRCSKGRRHRSVRAFRRPRRRRGEAGTARGGRARLVRDEGRRVEATVDSDVPGPSRCGLPFVP